MSPPMDHFVTNTHAWSGPTKRLSRMLRNWQIYTVKQTRRIRYKLIFVKLSLRIMDEIFHKYFSYKYALLSLYSLCFNSNLNILPVDLRLRWSKLCYAQKNYEIVIYRRR